MVHTRFFCNQRLLFNDDLFFLYRILGRFSHSSRLFRSDQRHRCFLNMNFDFFTFWRFLFQLLFFYPNRRLLYVQVEMKSKLNVRKINLKLFWDTKAKKSFAVYTWEIGTTFHSWINNLLGLTLEISRPI